MSSINTDPLSSIPYNFRFTQLVDTSELPWKKLNGDAPFSEIHRKYWGHSVDKEAEDWRNLHHHLFSQNHPVPTSSRPPDSCESIESFEGDDLIDGCHILHVPELELRPLLVRAEYVRLYDVAVHHYKDCVQKKKTTGTVITGQPGIGESSSLLVSIIFRLSLAEHDPAGKSVGRTYILRRMIGERLPVLWQSATTLYLLAADGAYSAPDSGSIFLKAFIIVLVDADPLRDVPPRLIAKMAHTFPILTTSPDHRRWNRWHKTRMQAPLVLVMNPWKRQELYRA
jgi:hypothetical protein